MIDSQEVREKLRAQDPVKIARRFVSSRFTYGADSKQRTPNTDWHRTICQTESGDFVDEDGRKLPLSEVPPHIRGIGKPPVGTGPAPRRELTLAEAVREADSRSARADAPAPESLPKPRGRRAKK